MSLYVDKLFINRVSFNLEKFKWTAPATATFRCNLCGDSKKRKNLTRGYFYVAKDASMYRFCCKNCHVDLPFWFYLKKYFYPLYQDYKLEKMRSQGKGHLFDSIHENKSVEPEIYKVDLPSISQLPLDHHAVDYVYKRQIPKKHHSIILYAKDVHEFVSRYITDQTIRDRYMKKDALVFVQKDAKGVIGGFTFRYFDNTFRYQIAMIRKDAHRMFGVERFNRNKPGFVVEGPIDSLFLPNCLAACGADLKAAERYIDKDKTILVYDNEPRNEQIVAGLEKAIKENYNVYIAPSTIEGIKDINDLVMRGYTSKQIIELLVNNSCRGLRAKIVWQSWKKS